VTPNHITTAGLVLGLLGAWWLAAPSARLQFYGALVLWFCCLLDGCDGEIARLKHLSSPEGAAYDVWADHFSHLATFVALPVGVARLHPGRDWLVPGVLLVTGFLACGFSVWYLVLRVPEEERGPLALTVERIASRDYVYLIVALTAIGRLDWFVWAAAVGSHLFNAFLWLQSRRVVASA
jgi:phosphatidylglycerophosphate synthase